MEVRFNRVRINRSRPVLHCGLNFICQIIKSLFSRIISQQEDIPIGCIPPAFILFAGVQGSFHSQVQVGYQMSVLREAMPWDGVRSQEGLQDVTNRGMARERLGSLLDKYQNLVQWGPHVDKQTE